MGPPRIVLRSRNKYVPFGAAFGIRWNTSAFAMEGRSHFHLTSTSRFRRPTRRHRAFSAVSGPLTGAVSGLVG